MEYRTNDEKRYYGSDYNKYLQKECRKNMTVMNIDCLQWDFEKGILRLIESKHRLEKIDKKSYQFKALHFISTVFNWLNNIARRYVFQIYFVIGSPPYDELLVENLVTNKITKLTGEDVKKFSELEISP